MKFVAYCSLFVILIFCACKKGGNSAPQIMPDPPYWMGPKITVKDTDKEFFNMVGTPDTFFHMGQWSQLAAYKIEWEPIHQMFAFTMSRKNFLTLQAAEIRQIAPGKDNELYVLPFYLYQTTKDFFRLDKDYKTFTDIGSNLESALLEFGYLREYHSLATDKNGDVYIGLVGNKNYTGQACYIARSRDKGETFKLTEIPGYANYTVSKILVDNDGLLYVKMSNGDILYHQATSGNWKMLYKGEVDERVRDFACAGSGNIYVASSKGFFLSKDEGASITQLPKPSDMLRPEFENVYVNKKGSIYATADTLNVNRPDYSISNCYYSIDKGATWKHVRERGDGTSKMTIQGFDVAGRLLATFTDSTRVPRDCCINAKYIQFGFTTKAVE